MIYLMDVSFIFVFTTIPILSSHGQTITFISIMESDW